MLWSKVLSVLAVVAGTTFAAPVEHATSGQGRLFPRNVDYCAQAYNASLETDSGWFPAPLALKCLQSLPYDQSVAESIIDSFIKMFAFYSVESYAKNSPNPKVQLNVDIPGKLASIKAGIQTGKYSFFEYQYALDTLVTSLNDGMAHQPLRWRVLMIGHTGYTDSCTGGFFTRFPVPMVLLSPDGQQDPQVYVCQFNTWLTTGHQLGDSMGRCSRTNIVLTITIFNQSQRTPLKFLPSPQSLL